MSAEKSFVFKILVGGSGGVGKTTLLHRFVFHEFFEDTSMTIGAQIHSMNLERNGCNVSLAFWDLAGQDRFRFILPNYCNGAHGGFVLFDMSRYDTIVEMAEWIKMFKQNAPNGTPIMAVGTKFDIIDPSQVETIDQLTARIVAENQLVGHSLTSAKFDLNIDETIYFMIDWLISLQPSDS